MKKFGLLIVVGITIILSGCNYNKNILPNIINTLDEKEDVIVEDIISKKYNPSEKPTIRDMENFDAIVNGYVRPWKMDYTINEDDLKHIDEHCDEFIIEGGRTHTKYSNTFKKSDIKSGKKIILSGTYNFNDSKLQLNNDENNILSKRGWNIIPGDRYENYYKLDYSENSANDIAFINSEEWISLYKKIGGSNIDYERYPANTVLITNDLLLHSFHKLFDNTLKYYEQTSARNTIKDLSNKLFNKFVNLAKNESDSNLKSTYEFLAAYWSVPSILLVDSDKFNIKSIKPTNDNKEIKKIIIDNEKYYLYKLSPLYEEIIPGIIENVLDAKELADYDPFLYSYSPKFILKKKIKQDYTQFVPRSHYTDNAELKTYFMAMKWLMREKFYFGDDKLTNAALVMVNDISNEDIVRLGEFSAKIKKLIGGDDDLTLESLTAWMKDNEINNVEKIKKLTKEQREDLLNLVPQKIQSTAYSTQGNISEDDAKKMTAGFVFFGEKFTLDSYLFDLTTASSTEEEFKIKPKKQTALIVPDVLEGNGDAAQIVDLWLKEGVEEEKKVKDHEHILEDVYYTQYSSYNDVKKEAKKKIEKEINESAVMNSVYHKWLNMIGLLVGSIKKDVPYFKLDPLYKLKNLVTYMGSYTELKHDTLLYVKQPYVGDATAVGPLHVSCSIRVNPPSLPIPKGYIEADIDIINKLIELNEEVKFDFGELGEHVKQKFSLFDKFLVRIKSILLQQMNNQVISDEDFERMRLAYDELSYIIYPLGRGSFGEDVYQKEMRSALIADIFTSEYKGNVDPLYEAIGRPALMLVMIGDINGNRVAIGPVFTHYEFYNSDKVINTNGGRLNDIQWQAIYDSLSGKKLESALSTLSKELYKGLNN